MNKKLRIALGVLILGIVVIALSNVFVKENITKIEQARLNHEEFLKNSPFKNTEELTKTERFEQGLPPNKYFERIWELTMNPELGRPTTENLEEIRSNIKEERLAQLTTGRVPGDAADNNWIERGPNNVGGRSRAVIFDPNDPSNNTVFAGGVSGGLWKNTNISSLISTWTQVDFPEHVNISCIAVDPNDSNIFYVGTGERQTATFTNISGNGLWKSEDAGISWTQVFGGPAAESEFGYTAKVTVNSPAGIAGEYGAVDSNYGGVPLSTAVTGNLVLVDDGTAIPTEGCNALNNGASVNGNIALIYRGTCNFTVKVKNAENAGAIAVVMINNIPGTPIVMGGDDATITIPSVMISNADGQLMVDQLGSGVNVTLEPDSSADLIGSSYVSGNQYINDAIVRDNAGTSEVYIAAGATGNFEGSTTTWLGPNNYGVFLSINGGTSWTATRAPKTAGGYEYEPYDLEIGADNTVWMSTINNIYGEGGGSIFSATSDTFVLEYTLTDASRTQIATSATNADKIYVLADGTTAATPVIMEKTDDSFLTTTSMSLPDDADNNIPANDFTRGQANFDLVIKVDPTNDSKIFVGGIDLFSSSNEGGAWSQISKWSNNNNLLFLNVPLVHADQHTMAFGNGDASKMLFGTDGGIYFSSDSGTSISARNTGYNVTQFYTVGVAPTTALTGDYFAGGTQDNGTPYFENAGAGVNQSVDVTGGDGAATMFDQDGSDTYFITNYVYNNSIEKREITGGSTVINSETLVRGDFINQQTLDSNNNILYTNYSYVDALGNELFIIKRYDFDALLGPSEELTNALLDSKPTALSVSPFTTVTTTLMAGLENGSLLKLTNADNNPTWTEITGSDFLGSISDVEFGQDENEIFVTMFNYGIKNIWYTSDGGITWLDKEGDLPDMPVKTILQNPLNTNQVIIGTDLGIWYTDSFSSASPKWSSAFNGMSNVIITDLDLRDDNTIFAATHGRGIFSGKFTAEELSVENNILVNGISIYPTISTGRFSIKSNLNLANDVRFNVFNISGQKVYSSELNLSNNTQEVNLELASGIYLAQFVVDNGSETKKIIIE